jgi:uncharacterized protein YbjT (DUF2867 family)
MADARILPHSVLSLDGGSMVSTFSVVLLGATGAVGSHVARTLTTMPDVARIAVLARRPLEGVPSEKIHQSMIDVFDPSSYEGDLPGRHAAICTLGVGEPSKVTREAFVRIDKEAVLAFASACRSAGVRHFQLLGSVGANPKSRSFYLRPKGELEEGLKSLGFERLSLFRPSMILTPTNRYGMTQALALAVTPHLKPVLAGGLRKYRGIAVDRLGRAMALNLRGTGTDVEVLHWDSIEALAES